MCLNETYSTVRVGNHLSDMFTIKNGSKQGDALSPTFFNFALQYDIWGGSGEQDGLKLNGIYQLLVCVDDVNILGESIHTLKKNIETLVVVSKEIGLDLNRDKTRYMVMFRDFNVGRSQNIKIDKSSFESVEKVKYLGTT